MYIRHNPLFSFDTLMKYKPKTRLAMVYKTIDLHPCLKKLARIAVRGPKGYSFSALIKAFLAMRLCSIPTVSLLVDRLKTDLLFRCDCSFSIAQPVPSSVTSSRFFQRLTNTDGLQELFSALVDSATADGLISGKLVAIDASAIDSYEKPIPKKNLVDDGSPANWGTKLKTHGNQHI